MADARHHVEVTADMDSSGLVAGAAAAEAAIRRLGESEAAANRKVEGSETALAKAKDRHRAAQQKLNEVNEVGSAGERRRAAAGEKYWAGQVRDAEAALKKDAEFHRKTVENNAKARAAIVESHEKSNATIRESDQKVVSARDADRRKDVAAERKAAADKALAVLAESRKGREEARRVAKEREEERRKDEKHETVLGNLQDARAARNELNANKIEKAESEALRASKKAANEALADQLRVEALRSRGRREEVAHNTRMRAVREGRVRAEAGEVRAAERHAASMARQEAAEARRVATFSSRQQRGGRGLWRGITGTGRRIRDSARRGFGVEADEARIRRTGNAVKQIFRDMKPGAGDSNIFTPMLRGVDDFARGVDRWVTRSLPKLFSFQGAILAIVVAFGPLLSMVSALGAAGVGAANVIGALAGSLVAVPGLFAAAAASIGVLMIAMIPMANAFKAFNTYLDATRAGSHKNAQAQKEAALNVLAAQHAYERAGRAVTEAQYDERRSQVALNAARKEAARQLQDLRNEMDKLHLNEEGAILAVKQAEDDYRRTLADGNATALDREQALHRLKEAEFDLRDVRVQNKRTTEDATLAEKRGVESAENVVDARHAQKQATEQIAEAQWQLAEAWRQLHKAQAEGKAGGAAALKAQWDLADAMARLSPNARKVAEAIFGLNGAWDHFSKRIQNNLFAKLAGDTKLFAGVLREGGGVDSILTRAATAMGVLADKALRMFADWDKNGDLKALGDVTTPIIENLGQAMLSVATAFKDITIAAKPFTDWLSLAIKKVADRFADWAAGLKGNKEWAIFLGNIATTLSQLGTIASNVFGGLFGLFQASAPFTKWFLDRIVEITSHFKAFGEAANNDKHSGFRNWLDSTKPLLHDVWEFVKSVASAIGEIASDPRNMKEAHDVLKALAETVLPALVGIFGKLSESHAISDLVTGIGTLLKAVKEFLDVGGTLPIKVFIETLINAFERWFRAMHDYPILGKIFSYILSGLALLAAAKLTGLFRMVTVVSTLVGWLSKLGFWLGKLAFKGLDALTGGRLGRAGGAVKRRTRSLSDATRDKLPWRQRGETAQRRQYRSKTRAGKAAASYEAQRIKEGRPEPVTPKTIHSALRDTNSLLERIERNTRRTGGGGGPGAAGGGPERPAGGPGGSTRPSGGRGGEPYGGRPLRMTPEQRRAAGEEKRNRQANNRRLRNQWRSGEFGRQITSGEQPTPAVPRGRGGRLVDWLRGGRAEEERTATRPHRAAPTVEAGPIGPQSREERLQALRARRDARQGVGGARPPGSEFGGLRSNFRTLRATGDAGSLDPNAFRRRSQPGRLRRFGKYGAIAGGIGAGAFFLPDLLGMGDAAYASDGEVDENGDPIDGGDVGMGAGALGMAAMFAPDLLGMGLDYLPDRGEESAVERQERRAASRAARTEARAARSGGRVSRLGGRLGRFGGGRLGRLGGGLARAGGRLGGVGRLGGGLLKGAGRLLKGGGVAGIGGAIVGMAADSGLFGRAGSAGKSLGQAAGATLQGASIGAMIGSVIPGVGTAIGAAVGGLAGFTYSLVKDPKLRKTMTGFFSGIGNWFVSTGKSIGSWFNKWVIQPVISFFVGVGRWFGRLPGRVGGWITQWIINPVVGFFRAVGGWFARLPGRVGGWIQGNIVNPIVGFFVGIGRWIGSLPGRVGGWVTENLVNPVLNFFRGIGGFIRNLPRTIMTWAEDLGGVAASLIVRGLKALNFESGGHVPGTFDGRQDTKDARLTPGEFVIRRDRMQQPDARRLAEAWNSGAFEAKDFYRGLDASVRSAPTTPPAALVSPTATVVNNSSTRNAGLNIDGGITINNPVRERSDRSMRHTLQTLAYMSRAER